jgi:hypothetical protein
MQFCGTAIKAAKGEAMKSLNAALAALSLFALPTWASGAETIHTVKASSFADPADIAAYKRCIASGKSESQCLKVGDNGIGKWGDDTTAESKPMCALPPDDWEARWGKGDAARGKKISVTYRDKTIVCELRDTMPRKASITNGAGIDLSPGAAKAFNKKPPFMLKGIKWQWVEGQ